MNALPLDVLACPACRGALEARDRSLACRSCPENYELSADGIADLVPPDVRLAMESGHGEGAWRRWREAMRGLEAWRSRRRAMGSVGVPVSDGVVDAELKSFLARAGVNGVVVDIGAKDGARAALLPEGACYVGVDPAPRRSAAVVVRGVAEALPVRDRVADAVTSFAAFDYFADPARAVDEMARVVKPGGVLAVVVSVVPWSVAQARGAPTRATRVRHSLRAAREVGWRAGASLLAAAALERDRPHTQYFTHGRFVSLLSERFDVTDVHDVPRSASTILYVIARRRRTTRLPILRDER